jgi:hypothetical protein
MLAHCNFCPWDCSVDRVSGSKFGACKLASGSRVSSHFHHTGEELFYRGTQGSGTIFFASCNMRCAFCQNGDISTDKDNGEETDPRTLAAMDGQANDCNPENFRRAKRQIAALYSSPASSRAYVEIVEGCGHSAPPGNLHARPGTRPQAQETPHRRHAHVVRNWLWGA